MMAAAWFAVMKAGGVCVATMPLLRAKELTDIITKAEVTHALCDKRLDEELKLAQAACPSLKSIKYWYDDGADSVDELVMKQPLWFTNVATAADDVALIAFTSGTTGKPKGTMHFHRDVVAMCDCFPRSILQAGKDDVFCGTPPLAFTFGLGGLLCFPMRIGASSVLVEKHTPETLLETIQRFKATVCFAAPVMYRGMAAIAGPVRPGLAEEVRVRGRSAARRHAPGVQAGDRHRDHRRHRLDRDDPHLHLAHARARAARRHRLRDPGLPRHRARRRRQAVRAGQGRAARGQGPTGCRYLADDRQKNYVRNGWNITGDAYMVDSDGYFFYQARTDDMIISAGYNIAGPEVEGALLLHPAVAECGVIGWPDEERGTIVKAFVVLKPGNSRGDQTARQLQEHVKKVIAPYKYPRAIEFVDALPRTETGKLQRFKLRKPA